MTLPVVKCQVGLHFYRQCLRLSMQMFICFIILSLSLLSCFFSNFLFPQTIGHDCLFKATYVFHGKMCVHEHVCICIFVYSVYMSLSSPTSFCPQVKESKTLLESLLGLFDINLAVAFLLLSLNFNTYCVAVVYIFP